MAGKKEAENMNATINTPDQLSGNNIEGWDKQLLDQEQILWLKPLQPQQ